MKFATRLQSWKIHFVFSFRFRESIENTHYIACYARAISSRSISLASSKKSSRGCRDRFWFPCRKTWRWYALVLGPSGPRKYERRLDIDPRLSSVTCSSCVLASRAVLMTVVSIDPRLSYVCTSTCSCVPDWCRLRLRALSGADAHSPHGVWLWQKRKNIQMFVTVYSWYKH